MDGAEIVGGEVIEQPRNETERWLMNTVAQQAQQAGIAMPQVAIYHAPDINAFATGAPRCLAGRRQHRAAAKHEP
jgi:heat shock protein HtpX